MSRNSVLFFFIFIFMIPFSCREKDKDLIPYVYVDFTIDILGTFYNELSAPGGYVYVTGGYKGILIYRLTMEEFLAFDRSCSFKPLEPCERIEMESSGIIMVDSCCGSRFSILDGSPFEGPATRMLRQYNTFFDGRYLRVFN
jgi:nitrite reductase/ring-hydroxylating ferredoxin subunit